MMLTKAISAAKHWRAIDRSHASLRQPVGSDKEGDPPPPPAPNRSSLLNDLRTVGYAVIKNYWPPRKCEAGTREIDRLLAEYPNAVRHFSRGADQRMFGVEAQSKLLREFHEDRFLRSVGETLGAGALFNLATLGARIESQAGNIGSGEGWHRDAFAYQFKAIIYLCDVTYENGPFEYLVGSHKFWRVVMDAGLNRLEGPPESRMDDDRVNDLVAQGFLRKKTFTATAGTAILVNTAGVHRGAPLSDGKRYALTNYYYYDFQLSETLIDKFVPMVPGAELRLRTKADTKTNAKTDQVRQ